MIGSELSAKTEPPIDKNPETEQEFKIGDKVIVKRTSGDFESGWEINLILPGKAMVRKNELLKMISLADLTNWNDKNTFLTGQRVYLKSSDGLDWPGWVVKSGEANNGKITIFNKSIDESREVLPEQLLKDFSTPENENRYTPKKIIKK